LLDALGDRSGAVQEYEAFARRLGEELELEPAPETRALVEKIRSRSQVNGHAGAAAAEPATATAAASAPASAARPESRVTQTRGFRLGILAGALAVLTLLIVWAFGPWESDARDHLDTRRVLVLPFENQTGDPELDPLGAMVSDWISRGLEGTGLVQTVPPEAAAQLEAVKVTSEGRGADDRVVTMAELARAGTVVSGTVYLNGDSLQIEALVTNVRSQRVIADVVSPRVPSSEPLAAVESMRERVAGALATTFDGAISQYADVMERPPTYEAYRLFVQAQRMSDRAHTAGGEHLFAEALPLFLQAAEADTTLVAAYLRAGWMAFASGAPAMAESLAQVADARRERLTPVGRTHLDLLLAETRGDRVAALRAARRRPDWPLDLAIRANQVNRPGEAISTLTEAEWYPGALRSAGLYGVEVLYWVSLTEGYHHLGEHEAELEAAREARRLYPQNLDAVNLETRALAALGRLEELNEVLDGAAALQAPGRWVATPATVMLIAAFELRAHGYPAAAREAGDRAVTWTLAHPPAVPSDRAHRSTLALSYYSADRWDEAQVIYEQLALDYPDSVNFQGFLGTLAARRGDREEARRIAEQLAGLNDPYDFGRDTYWQACITALLKQREAALELLQRSYAEGRRFDMQLHRDLDLEDLSDYPPFQEFLRPKG
jgi:tetratricopeptide (TPR) repeat protein